MNTKVRVAVAVLGTTMLASCSGVAETPETSQVTVSTLNSSFEQAANCC